MHPRDSVPKSPRLADTHSCHHRARDPLTGSSAPPPQSQPLPGPPPAAHPHTPPQSGCWPASAGHSASPGGWPQSCRPLIRFLPGRPHPVPCWRPEPTRSHTANPIITKDLNGVFFCFLITHPGLSLLQSRLWVLAQARSQSRPRAPCCSPRLGSASPSRSAVSQPLPAAGGRLSGAITASSLRAAPRPASEQEEVR